jgi:hypothetical protein
MAGKVSIIRQIEPLMFLDYDENVVHLARKFLKGVILVHESKGNTPSLQYFFTRHESSVKSKSD